MSRTEITKVLAVNGALSIAFGLAVYLVFDLGGFWLGLIFVFGLVSGLVALGLWAQRNPAMREAKFSTVFSAAAFVLAVVVVLMGAWMTWVPDQTTSAPRLAGAISTVQVTGPAYRVERGDILHSIAIDHGVGVEALLLHNEPYLKAKYEQKCKKFGALYRDNPKRKGLFCNDRYHRPYGNTLMPGWILHLPFTSAPANISQAVAGITGKRIALVIDDTGSMGNDRRDVGEFYLAALRAHGKEIVGVYVFANGEVRKFTANGNIDSMLLNEGDQENTFGALTVANADHPDEIILVTDEAGDDWDWDVLDQQRFPPVIAHCLPTDSGLNGCESTLHRLADHTRGQYVSSLN